MKRQRFGVAMAHLVMESIADLQRERQPAAVKDIKEHILAKYGDGAQKVMALVPQYIHKGVNLGIISRMNDNYRTRMYVAKRRRGRRGGGKVVKKRRRRRRRNH